MVSLCGFIRLLLFSYKGTFLFITVSLILFLQSSAITWTKTPANPVSGTLGKNVTLEWNYTLTSTNVLTNFVLLKFKGRPSTKIMKYDKSGIVFYDSFSEKVVLLQRGTPSFMLLNLTMDDKAEYCCEVNTRPSANGMQGHSEVNCTQLIILEPPTITVISPNQTVNESNDVRLSCHASGTPPPSITWSKASNEEKTLNSSTVLSLKNINRNQDGLYLCTAINGPGKAIASVRVTVHYSPSITQSTKRYNVTERHDVYLECISDGKPPPVVTWTKIGGPIGSVPYPVHQRLPIMNANRTAIGTYMCTAVNGIGKAAKATRDLVVFYAPIINPLTKRFNVTEGNDVELDCISDGMPLPVVTWTKVGKVLNVSQSADGRISIINATRTEAGIYICTVTNGIGKPAKATRYLNVFYPPSIINTHSNHTVTEQQDLRLKCNASGNPQPEIIWTKRSNPTRLPTVGGVLVVKNVKNNDSGDYQCKASNGIGDDAISIVTIIVNYAPAINPPTKRYNVTEGNHMDLACNSDGKPLPIVTWTKINQTSSDSYPSGQRLAITHANRADAGTYVCTATNGIGKPANATRHLNVFYPPSMIKRQDSQTVNETDDLRLVCNASGNPPPKITWTKRPSLSLLNSTDGVLVVKGVVKADSGYYQCKASNGIGEDAITTSSVMVNYKPRATNLTSNVEKMDNVFEGQTITFFCSADSVPPAVYEFRFEREFLGYSKNGVFVIQSVNSSHKGEYECVPSNILGTGDIAAMSLNVLFPSLIDFVSNNATAKETDNITLFCNATGNPPANITWAFLNGSHPTNVTSGETLTLYNISRSEAGTYQCTAGNGVMADARVNVHVTVNYKPEMKNNNTMEIWTWIDHETVVHCEARGVPLPDITWSRDGTVTSIVQSQSRVSTLKFTPKTSDDFGFLACTATNLMGSTTQRVILNMLAEPEAPLIVQINPGLNEMKIQWKESVTDPDAPVLEYLVQLREKNEQSMEWRSCTEMRKPLTCLMTGLRKNTKYTIRVAARNVVGYSAFTIKEAETTLDEASPTVGVTTTTEAEDERDEDDKKIKRFKDQSGFSIYVVLGGVIGTLVIIIVVIARQRRKCGRATLNKTANKSLKDEENGHDNEAYTENPAKKEEEDQV